MVATLVLLPFFGASSVMFVRVIGSTGVAALCSLSVLSSLGLWGLLSYESLTCTAPVVLTESGWFESVSITMSFGLGLHPLSLALLMAVLPVSCGVHFYSGWYLASDPHLARFMSYISLFTSSMVLLTVGTSTTVLFVGWESISVMSYLLIAYWTTRETALQSAVQALLLNRMGDLALTCALACLLAMFGTTGSELASLLSNIGSSALMVCICGGVIVAAMGKSAQLGLHSWLPNAMEAPTPVSALIHAATLVTASVYLLIRLGPLLEQSMADASSLVALLGAATLLFAGLIGTRQTDLKRVIAFSTCSQVAYMILAVSAGLYSASLSLLVMHAAYKALLFLGAGVVIHAIGGLQDVRVMGSFSYTLPLTAVLMLIAGAALGAMPYTSGDYSKDLLIEQLLGGGMVLSQMLWSLAVIGAGLTLFYSARLQRLVFEGVTRSSSVVLSSTHEAGVATIVVVLSMLCSLALFEGFMMQEWFSVNSSALNLGSNPVMLSESDVEWSLGGAAVLAPLLASAIGLVAGLVIMSRRMGLSFYYISLVFANKFYFDTMLNAGIGWTMNMAWIVYGSVERSALELVGPYSVSLILHRVADLYQLVVSRVSLYRVLLIIVVTGLLLIASFGSDSLLLNSSY